VAIRRKPVTNILMTCANDAGTGGVQLVFRQLVRSLEQNGKHVHLLYGASPLRPRLVQGTTTWGHTAFYCPLPGVLGDRTLLGILVLLAYLPVTVLRLIRVIRGQKIDVINCHYLTQYFIHFVIAARLLRVPLVVSVHGADIDRYVRSRWTQRFILRLVMRGAHNIVACSQALARQTAQTFPDVRRKVTYVHNGLMLSDFSAVGEARPLTTPFVLSVCRQVEKKGTDTLLRAFALVRRDFPDLSLVIVGDGPVLEQNKALARALQIESQVRFLGDVARPEVFPFFAACALFVLPSRAEPFGLVLLEAAYFKKGIVGTRVGGIPEIITDGVDGFLVEPDGPVDMAQKMTVLLRDPQLAQMLGARAHQTLMTKFLWEDRVQEYLSLYEGGLAHSLVWQESDRVTFDAV